MALNYTIIATIRASSTVTPTCAIRECEDKIWYSWIVDWFFVQSKNECCNIIDSKLAVGVKRGIVLSTTSPLAKTFETSLHVLLTNT